MAAEGVEMQGTECPVCHENYNDPKILPCAHIFCRDCLVSWMKKKTEALCPLCCSAIVDSQDSSASNTDDIVDSLPTDHTMTALMESVKIFSEEHVCYLHRSVSAPSWCFQCNVKLCQSCVDVHKSLPVTSVHKLEDLSTLTLEGLTTTRREPCSLHPDKTSELFCTFHNVLICHVCATSKHRMCPEIICQQEMYEKYKQTLSELEDKLNVSISALSEVMTKIEEHQIKSDKTTMSAFEQIDITCNSLLNCIEAFRKRLKKLVQEADDKIKAKVVEQKSSLGNRRGRLTAHLNLIQRVQQIASCSSLVTMVPQLKDRITNLGLATALPAARQDFKMITLTIDRRALFLVERELEKIGDIVVSSSSAQASNKKTAEIKEENKEYDFKSQGVCKLVIPTDMLKEIIKTKTVSGLCGQMKFENKDTELPISRDEAAKLFVKHMSESRKQSEVLQNKTDLIREMDVLEYEALKYLCGQDFTGLFQEMSKENSDTRTISISLHNNKADRNLIDKLCSLRQEDIVLNPDEFEKVGLAIDAKSEGLAAFIKLLPDQGKLRIYSCDYNAMSEAKHLVDVKLGKVRLTTRTPRKFDGGNTKSDGSYTDSPFQRSDPHCLAGVHKDFLTKSSIKVSVYKADITQLTLDVIVNAADENLSHGGGVAAAIARAAGVSLELEGYDYVMENGPIPVTEVVMTYAGNLPCKTVFHAVGPRWNDYTDKAKCQHDLMQTVFNCLVKAHSHHFETIAVSSISSAIQGVPKEVCAKMYLQAVQKFEEIHGGKSSLKFIHFVDINPDMVGVIQDTFTELWDSCFGHSEIRRSKGDSDATASAQLSGSQQQRTHSSGMMPVDDDTKQQQSLYPKFEIIPVEQNGNKKLFQYQFHFPKLDLIIQQKDIDCVLTDSIILWQTAGKKYFEDEISMRIHTTSLGKQYKARELSEVERNLKKGVMGVIIANNKQLLYPVITSRNDIKHSIRYSLEAALTKMDEQKKKTLMVPRFPYAEKKGSKCFKEMLEEFATGVYMAVRNYTQRLNRSVTEVYIFDPDEDPDEDNVTTMVNTIAFKAGEDNTHIN